MSNVFFIVYGVLINLFLAFWTYTASAFPNHWGIKTEKLSALFSTESVAADIVQFEIVSNFIKFLLCFIRTEYT